MGIAPVSVFGIVFLYIKTYACSRCNCAGVIWVVVASLYSIQSVRLHVVDVIVQTVTNFIQFFTSTATGWPEKIKEYAFWHSGEAEQSQTAVQGNNISVISGTTTRALRERCDVFSCVHPMCTSSWKWRRLNSFSFAKKTVPVSNNKPSVHTGVFCDFRYRILLW